MGNFKHISVAGTIGAGKSTLIKGIADRLDFLNKRIGWGQTPPLLRKWVRYVVLPEPHEVEGSESSKFADDYFNNNDKVVSFAFQTAVLVDIRQQLSEAEANAEKDVMTIAISERCWLEAEIFWKFLRHKSVFEEKDLVSLSNTRQSLFKDTTPDGFIWVELPHNIAYNRAVVRGNGRNIAPQIEDFRFLEMQYNDFFKQVQGKILHRGVSAGGQGANMLAWELAKMVTSGELSYSEFWGTFKM